MRHLIPKLLLATLVVLMGLAELNASGSFDFGVNRTASVQSGFESTQAPLGAIRFDFNSWNNEFAGDALWIRVGRYVAQHSGTFQVNFVSESFGGGNDFTDAWDTANLGTFTDTSGAADVLWLRLPPKVPGPFFTAVLTDDNTTMPDYVGRSQYEASADLSGRGIMTGYLFDHDGSSPGDGSIEHVVTYGNNESQPNLPTWSGGTFIAAPTSTLGGDESRRLFAGMHRISFLTPAAYNSKSFTDRFTRATLPALSFDFVPGNPNTNATLNPRNDLSEDNVWLNVALPGPQAISGGTPYIFYVAPSEMIDEGLTIAEVEGKGPGSNVISFDAVDNMDNNPRTGQNYGNPLSEWHAPGNLHEVAISFDGVCTGSTVLDGLLFQNVDQSALQVYNNLQPTSARNVGFSGPDGPSGTGHILGVIHSNRANLPNSVADVAPDAVSKSTFHVNEVALKGDPVTITANKAALMGTWQIEIDPDFSIGDTITFQTSASDPQAWFRDGSPPDNEGDPIGPSLGSSGLDGFVDDGVTVQSFDDRYGGRVSVTYEVPNNNNGALFKLANLDIGATMPKGGSVKEDLEAGFVVGISNMAIHNDTASARIISEVYFHATSIYTIDTVLSSTISLTNDLSEGGDSSSGGSTFLNCLIMEVE